MQRLLTALLSLATDFCYLMLLLALVLFIFALLGVQLFGGHFRPPTFETPPRENFESIGSAMITVFIIACGEAWNEVWVNTYVAVGAWTAPFFIALVVGANYMLLNLVIALLIGSFGSETTATATPHTTPIVATAAAHPIVATAAATTTAATDATATAAAAAAAAASINVTIAPLEEKPEVAAPLGWWSSQWVHQWVQAVAEDDRALMLLRPGHPVRRAASSLVGFHVPETAISFENLVVLLILVSSATMAFETCELHESSKLAHAIQAIDTFAIVVFTLEMLAKVRSRQTARGHGSRRICK